MNQIDQNSQVNQNSQVTQNSQVNQINQNSQGGRISQTSPLGDRTVRRIGFGAMQLAGPWVFGPPKDPDAARAVLRRAVELGVNHIDTAQVYGPDVVNELLADVLHPYPEDLVIATKVGGARDAEGGWVRASRPDQLRRTVEQDLRTLRVERLDLVNMRRGVGGGGPDPVPLAEQLGTLTELRDEGKLDLIGLSTVSAEDLAAALAVIPIAEVQNAYSIANRTDEAVLDLCRAHGIAFVPYYPLGSAFTGGPEALAADPAIAAVAARHGVSASQIALAWLLAHYDRMLLIPGTGSVAHLEENLAVDGIRLDATDLAGLEAVTHVSAPGF
ncbi:pyridoxine 4-dehydrogenase [Streptomyces sp. B3I7]|uniref:aldo/keto reductase n=1 Tax=Streptomyces sp. B3I7 TaxID=3042269 RepID=UPI0027828179|nr:aldo/keto reductase [Streptomyces sp. B3I7]MDQ0813251.1 pyridoxine 4-dehydrogenase [Streptomyces sp. B3I7]